MFLHTPNLKSLKGKILFPDILLQPTKKQATCLMNKVFLQLGKTLGFERCYLQRCYLQLLGFHKPLVLVLIFISKL